MDARQLKAHLNSATKALKEMAAAETLTAYHPAENHLNHIISLIQKATFQRLNQPSEEEKEAQRRKDAAELAALENEAERDGTWQPFPPPLISAH
jgi:hypothetical protein